MNINRLSSSQPELGQASERQWPEIPRKFRIECFESLLLLSTLFVLCLCLYAFIKVHEAQTFPCLT